MLPTNLEGTTVATQIDPNAGSVAQPATAPKKRGRKANGEKSTPTKHGFGMKQLSTAANDTVKKLAQQLEVKEHTIYTAGVLLFDRLSLDDQFTMITEAKKLHAQTVKAEQEKTPAPKA